ncbi:FtsW/RodA/SpoVE family cell cycle protein [Halobacillus sp. Cin3]|uniref:FtsW/RodA/SpoVE family cell cycle protein n=1 Tax=Halobacillus sp. Cin3 TaxID=2928441 RepID=UPI00248E5220|nr:FtsW/RodA/SpoVE family cell cycle protein [Halobacillus sp. Cin3]
MKSRNDYLQTVQSFIKNKETGGMIARELNSHIQQEKESLMNKGYSSDEAEEEAVRRMGSAPETGRHFQDLYKERIDGWLVLFLAGLMVAGFLTSFMFSGEDGYSINGKFFFTMSGIAVAGALLFIDYRKLQPLGWLLYGLGLAGVMFLKWGPMSMTTNFLGSVGVRIGPFHVTSIDFIPLLLIGLAAIGSKGPVKVWKGILLYLFPVYFFMEAADPNAAFIYTLLFTALFLHKQVNKKILLSLVSLGVIGAVSVGMWFFTAAAIYQKERLLSFFSPEKFSNGGGYMYLRMEEVIRDAAWIGEGAQAEPLPSGHTDFVFLSVLNQLGWGAALLLLILLSLVLGRLFWMSRKIKEPFGQLLVRGSLVFYAVPVFYHVLMSMGILPTASFPLPFLSYGMDATVLHAALFGLVLSVYRKKHPASFAAQGKTRVQ